MEEVDDVYFQGLPIVFSICGFSYADGDNGSKHYIASLGGSRTGQGSASGWNLQA